MRTTAKPLTSAEIGTLGAPTSQMKLERVLMRVAEVNRAYRKLLAAQRTSPAVKTKPKAPAFKVKTKAPAL